MHLCPKAAAKTLFEAAACPVSFIVYYRTAFMCRGADKMTMADKTGKIKNCGTDALRVSRQSNPVTSCIESYLCGQHAPHRHTDVSERSDKS